MHGKTVDKERKKRGFCVFAGLCSGSVTALSYCVPTLWWLCLISLTPLLFCMLFLEAKKTALFSYAFSLHVLVLSFFYCMQPELGQEGGYAFFLLSLGILLASLFLLLDFFLAFFPYLLLASGKKERKPWKRQEPVFLISLFALCYLLAEQLQERLLYPPFPWVRLAAMVTPCTLLIQPAAWFGGSFVSGIVCLINGLFLLLFLECKRGGERGKRCRPGIFLLGGFLGSVLLLSAFRLYLGEKEEREAKRPVEVLLVQGNFSGEEKWRVSAEEMAEAYLFLTQEAAKEGTTLVVWPETAVPLVLTENEGLCEEFRRLCDKTGVELFLGAFARENGKEYNALYQFTAKGLADEVYYKQKLVPFGEFLPFEGLLSYLAPALVEQLTASGYQTAGEETVLFSAKGGMLGGIICYESIFPEVARKAVLKGAELLLLISNDSWFQNSAALYQHHAQAMLRAAETGRYVLRAGNTGITSVISPYGRVVSALPVKRQTALAETVSFLAEKTGYVRFGDSWIFAAVVLESMVGVLYNKKKSNEEKNQKKGGDRQC